MRAFAALLLSLSLAACANVSDKPENKYAGVFKPKSCSCALGATVWRILRFHQSS